MSVSNLMPESASRTERKRTHNRDALIAAARGLFARAGFDGTTIADITEAADLGFGTFYRYFADKEAVLEAVLDGGRAEIDAVLLAEEPAGTPAATALTRQTERFAGAVGRNRDLLSLMWRVAMNKTGRRPLNIDRLGPEQSLPAVLTAAIKRIVEEGIAGGEFAPGNATLLSRLIAGAHMALLGPPPHDEDERVLVATLCDFELRALGARTAGAPQKQDSVKQPVRRRAVGGH